MKNEDSNDGNTCILFKLGSRISCRRVLNIMVFLGFMVNYMLRVNLTFAIVYMVMSSNNVSTRNDTPSLDQYATVNGVPSNRTRRDISSVENSASSLSSPGGRFLTDAKNSHFTNLFDRDYFSKTNFDNRNNNNNNNNNNHHRETQSSEDHLTLPTKKFFDGESPIDAAENNKFLLLKADSATNKNIVLFANTNNNGFSSGSSSVVREKTSIPSIPPKNFLESFATFQRSNSTESRQRPRVGRQFERDAIRDNVTSDSIGNREPTTGREISREYYATDSNSEKTVFYGEGNPNNGRKTEGEIARIWFSNDDDSRPFNPADISDNLLAATDVPPANASNDNVTTTAASVLKTNPTAATSIDTGSDANIANIDDKVNVVLPESDATRQNRTGKDAESGSTSGQGSDAGSEVVVKDVSLGVVQSSEEPASFNSEYNKQYNKFSWSEKKQGFLLGSFFWGYVCTELPGGRLAELIGARSVFGYATLGASVVTLLTPLSAKISFFAVMVLRVVIGVFLGPTWPSVLPLAAKWIPPDERGKFMSNMMASTLGAAFTLPVCSFIIETSSWEYVFYVTGLVGFLWSLCWFILVYDSPAEHPRITVQERRYIENRLKIKSHLLLDEEKYDSSSPYTSDQEGKQIVPTAVVGDSIDDERNISPTVRIIPLAVECDGVAAGDTTDDKEMSEMDEEDSSRCVHPEANSLQSSADNSHRNERGDLVKRNGHIGDNNNVVGAAAPRRNSNSPTMRAASNRNGSLTSSRRSKSSVRRESGIPMTPTQQPSTGVTIGSNGSSASNKSSHANAPWLKIATSIPVWAFVITHTASVFGYNTITVQLPTYMKHILHYNIKSNGILSSLPYLGKYIMAIVAGSIADTVLKSNVLSKTAIRKLFTTLAVMIPGFLMILQVYLGEDKVISIVIFTAALTINGLVTGGYLGNTLDLAPNYSGTIFGMGNMFSSAGGAVSALIVGYLTNNNQVYGQWQIVFWIVGLMYIGGATFFLIFGTTDIQPWNSPDAQKSKVEHKESKPLDIMKS